ncbi:hypothetical protein EPO15_07740 [bacterium]|nr:MAG: hypothetical protein EPO15_07740 [bacterium]
MSERGEFRGAGHFRIDRTKALEKLSAFSLERGTDFLLPLARCAAAAGARRLGVSGTTVLQAAFDGEPFARGELADPYGALFVEDAAPRRRHFASFLLGVLRTRPSEVQVVSGPAGARHRLRTSGVEREAVEPDGGRDVGTTVRVRWGPVRWLRACGPAKAAAEAAWTMTPALFTVDGAAPSALPEARLVARSQAGDLTLRLAPPEDPAETRITFCCLGVAVETIKTLLPGVQVRAWVDDAAFALTASQAAVVEDVRRQRALDAVAAAAAGFLADTARRFAAAFPEGKPASGGPAWAAEARAWFRAAALREAEQGRPLPEPVWETPFLVDPTGRALALGTLRRGIPCYSTARAAGARLPQAVAYCPEKADLALLKAAFSGSVLDATQLIESLAKLR